MSEHNGTDGYDFVLKGARVIDPYNKIDGMLDLAVSNNKIAGIGENLGGAKEIHDVTGKIVVPGMIDTHAHVFDHRVPIVNIRANLYDYRIERGCRVVTPHGRILFD